MAVTYKKLFKLLIDKEMKKKELCEQAKISTATVSKLANDENVTVEILARICYALRCGFDDIVEVVEEKEYIKDGINK